MTTGLATGGTPAEYVSQNPATGEIVEQFPLHDGAAVDLLLDSSLEAWARLRKLSVDARAQMLSRLADQFENDAQAYAALITREMGKPISEARQEIAKGVVTARTLASSGQDWLAAISVQTEAATS